MKHISLLVVVSVFLTSCFGIGDNSVVSTGLIDIKKEGFTMKAPENWRELSESELTKPKTGEIALALASASTKDSYINNLVILEVENKLGESSKGLMENTKIGLKSSLEKFVLIEEKNLIFSDNTEGTLLTYTGKYSKDTPELVYLQTVHSCENATYFLTLSISEKLESYEKYEYLLQSFECR